jgi:hypothetical protein
MSRSWQLHTARLLGIHPCERNDLNLPIGNVGYESIALSFEGAFRPATVFKGTAWLVEAPPEVARTGRFTTTRIESDK